MTPFRALRIVAGPLVAALVASGLASTALAHDFRAGELLVEHPWTRAVVARAATAAGYMTIVNSGQVADRLVHAETGRARAVEIHEMSMTDNIMRMRPVAGGLAVPSGGTLTLAPNGLHLMIVAPDEGFVQGARIPLTLVFERAGRVEIELAVESVRARAADHSGH
jgi:copper(I)-binding protein